MDDLLLKYYKEEMAYAQGTVNEFINMHPKIAARFGMSSHGVTDPELEKVIKTGSLSNAKLRYRLEDNFSEIADPILTALHAHYLLPVPSMSIVQIHPDMTALDTGLNFPKSTALKMSDAEEKKYSCMTCYDTTVWPLYIETAEFMSQIGDLSKTLLAFPQAQAILTVTLAGHEDITIQDLSPSKLRFFINASREKAYLLYEWLICHTFNITLISAGEHIHLDPEKLRPVGFEKDENLLPYSSHTEHRHRLLTEFFNLPEKFLFFEIDGLDDALAQFSESDNLMTIIFSFDKTHPDLERQVQPECFQLNCTPVINLFKESIPPFQLSDTQTEYLLQPAEGSLNTEIYAIENLQGREGTESHHYLQVYGIAPNTIMKGKHSGYWFPLYKPIWQGEHYLPEGKEVFLQIVDSETREVRHNMIEMHVDTLCFNRTLPSTLKTQLSFFMMEKKISHIERLMPFTPCRWPKTTAYAKWHILSHLNPNYLSISGKEAGAQAMREMLRLYDLDSSNEHAWIDGILELDCEMTSAIKRTVIERHLETKVWEGLTVTMQVDDSRFKKHSLLLFGAMEERYLAGFVPPTTYVQLVIVNQDGKILYDFPPRAGEQPLI